MAMAITKDVDADLLMTPSEAARFMKVSVSWLAKARMANEGPPYIRIGRSVRYRRTALTRWLMALER